MKDLVWSDLANKHGSYENYAGRGGTIEATYLYSLQDYLTHCYYNDQL